MQMSGAIKSIFSGEKLQARAARGLVIVLLGIGGNRVLRLVSSLLLTRILFPEAFGMMALIGVVMGGLQMFSDIGIRASIVQNKNGGDPNFVNTAWTIQVVRGFILSVITLILAQPLASFYGEPMLAQLMPIMALGPLMSGFASTNIATADRVLKQGRLMTLTLLAQLLGLIATVALALWTQSVFALAIGGQIRIAIFLFIGHRYLPGIRNRIIWDKEHAKDLIGFGKFVFLSTVATFILSRSDKAVLGYYLTLGTLGIYNIGYMLGSIPTQILKEMSRRVVFPLYSRRPPSESRNNMLKMRKARRMLVAGGLVFNTLMAFAGIFAVDLLFDDRYALAGPIVAVIALATVPLVVFEGYDSALLSAGDSRRTFMLKVSSAICQLTLLFIGLAYFGLFGAIIAPGLAALMTYPLLVSFVRRYDVWDPVADAGFLLLGLTITGLACAWQWDALLPLFDKQTL
jgi:O-antigen/teichoic acid export membrane protein